MAKITSKYYMWKYGKVRYIQAGRGEPLLLLHNAESGGSLHEWKGVFGKLSESHKVFAIDLLGFGGSEKPNITYSSYIYAKLINDFIQDVIRRPAVVAGVGLSGSLAVAASFLQDSGIKEILLIKPSVIQSNKIQYPQFGNVLLRWLLVSPGIGSLTYKAYCKLHHIADTSGASGRFVMASLVNGFLRVNISGKLKKTPVPVAVCDKLTDITMI